MNPPFTLLLSNSLYSITADLETALYSTPYKLFILLIAARIAFFVNALLNRLLVLAEEFTDYDSYTRGEWVNQHFTTREISFLSWRLEQNRLKTKTDEAENTPENNEKVLPESPSFISRLTLKFRRVREVLFKLKREEHEYPLQKLVRFVMFNFERVIYYVRNWVYSTNHKRIAVNYFWFVILSGVCGMILATIIRLEMAYPGIGVLAGDSLQYLSVVTAHAVIMVFFMIMPLLFGAFGNFLLPTQLGVHDVAFPRLNSAAFWFLPGGLLMLAQLVCLDRRYQRMNCFNIRELQTLLKNRYHPELLDERLHTDFLSQTSLITRFKLFYSNSTKPQMLLFNDYPLLNRRGSQLVIEVSRKRNSFFRSLFNSLQIWVLEKMITIIEWFEYHLIEFSYYYYNEFTVAPFHRLQTISPTLLPTTDSSYGVSERANSGTYLLTSDLFDRLNDTVTLPFSPYLCRIANSVITVSKSAVVYPLTTLVSSQNYLLLNEWVGHITTAMKLVASSTIAAGSVNSTKAALGNTLTGMPSVKSLRECNEISNHELANDYRFQKTQNPVFRYDFKVGHYMTESVKLLNRHMFSTFNDVTGGLRIAPWHFSENFESPFKIDILCFLAYYSQNDTKINLRETYIAGVKGILKDFPFSGHLASPTPTSGFYNFFTLFNTNDSFCDLRWVSLNSLDQKFHRMYSSSSMQQRVYSNWRQLKFTREAWRCKLLASRHQNTLYKRYINEDSVFWSVERNAKDVLPGWAMITPFSARTRFTAIGKVDLGLMGVFLVLNSSIVSSANFLVTYRYLSTLNNRKMRDARSFFTEGVMVASWMMIAANPMLAIGILMLLSDRHWQTSFFDYSGGGDTVLFQHMFWFFGHPEVYVIMIPTFGFNNTILSFYLRKRVSARASLLYSMYTIAFLGFFVWGHHMYMVGLAHTTRMLFSTLTVMISVPAATKLMHWCVTIVNSSITLELPLVSSFCLFFFSSREV